MLTTAAPVDAMTATPFETWVNQENRGRGRSSGGMRYKTAGTRSCHAQTTAISMLDRGGDRGHGPVRARVLERRAGAVPQRDSDWRIADPPLQSHPLEPADRH